jgi:ABC-type glycerol-3-phosphate transport system substrate-binding protein
MKPIRLLLLLITLLLTSTNNTTQNTIYLSIVLNPVMEEIWGDRIFDPFEAAHPGVEVILIPPPTGPVVTAPPSYDLQAHLESAREYATSADVVDVMSQPFAYLSVEMTRAGYYLDLKPLIDADAALDTTDFYEAAVQSFVWDGALWALPIQSYFWTLIYNRAAFDQANLNYPNANWTLDDFAEAVRVLTQRDTNGEVQVPGYMIRIANELPYLLATLTGRGFYDPTVTPNEPLFTQPELIEAMETLVALEEEGSVQWPDIVNPPGWVEDVALRLAPLSSVIPPFPEELPIAAAPLPGGGMGVISSGYAISAGTAYPELAYELVKYLTTDPVITSIYWDNTPAYRHPGNPDDAEVDFQPLRHITPEVTALIEDAREHSLPASELRYGSYLMAASFGILLDGVDVKIALEDAEILARENSRLAAESRGASPLVVLLPNLPPESSQNEITLTFGVMAFMSPLPNADHWQQFLEEFAATDPQVGYVRLDSKLWGTPEEWDCFFAIGNITATPDSANLLDIAPLTAADPDFETQDFIGTALQTYQDGRRTLGLPMALYPVGLWYDQQVFLENDLPLPGYGWTTQEFETALNTVSARPALELRPHQISDLLALIATYGGLPFDFRTDPPTLDFTSEDTIAAIEQVLALIESGLVGQSSFDLATETNIENPALFTAVLDSRSREFSMMQHGDMDSTPYRLTTLPVGVDYAPVSFGVGGGYIITTSAYPEACYRLLSRLALRPDLYQAMPARHSILETSQIPMADEVVAYYRYLADLTRQPEAIVITRAFNWEYDQFREALARTLAGETDLHVALSEAEQSIEMRR